MMSWCFPCRRVGGRAIFLTLAVGCWAPTATADMIGVTWTGDVMSIDECGGTRTLLGASGYGDINSMAKDENGKLVVATRGQPPRLIEIDPVTGAGVFLEFPFVNDIRGLAFDPNVDQRLFIAAAVGAVSTRLYTLDLSIPNPAPVLIDTTSHGSITALAFAADDSLYAWSVSWGLLTIDPATAVSTNVNGLIDGSSEIQSLAFAKDGSLVGVHDFFYSVDPVTGLIVQVGSQDLSGVRGFEFVDTPWLQDCSLVPSAGGVSASIGGSQPLTLNAGSSSAGDVYLVLGSASGTGSGLGVDQFSLYLELDAYFLYTLSNPNLLPLHNSLGLLDAGGQASASFLLPPDAPLALVGSRFHHAFLVIDAGGVVSFVSPPIAVEVLP